LVQCDACGVVLSPAIWQAQANEKMEEEWFGENYQPGTSFWVNLFETWNNHKTLARLAQAKPPGRRLLEIGVGSGSFLNVARARGYAVMGCDLSRPICERVRRAYGIAMRGEPLATLAGENRFDVIVMNHVLEHVHQPIEFLQDVRRLLAPNGVVHIAVPNIACWEAGLSGWTSFEPYHLTYFAPQTLKRTVSTSGLTIERVSTHDSFSGWFLVVLRTALGVNRASGAVTRPVTALTRRARGRRSGVVEHAYRIAMVCAGGGLWPLRWLQAKLGYGDEAICIARKPQTVPAQQGSK
jgi:2-polyprenyl-3-methyl-5-hydroxy-6-metoxy-1,4-benzoquinol methylase